MRHLPRLLPVLSLVFVSLCGSSQEKSAKPEEFDSPLTKRVNKPNVADAYPFLSADGLRLYFTSNREGGHGRFFVSVRKNVSEAFGEPTVLSKHLTDGYYAGSLTADELTLVMVKSGEMYLSKRKSMDAEFGKPISIGGIPSMYHFGPAISPDGQELLVMCDEGKRDVVKMYRRVSDTEFKETGELPIPENATPGPGQFSKDGLSYYFSFANSEGEVSIWRYARTSIHHAFVDLEELPVRINALKRNFQPSVNADASIIVHVTSQDNIWEQDDIVLVNDPGKALTAPEQFASVEKNEAKNMTVMSKILSAQIKTFPNPFQSDVIVEMSELPAAGTVFTLYDLSGKMIRQQQLTNNRTTITLGSLPTAIYVYHVTDSKRKLLTSGKLVKGQ